jgi:hypothetical protein
MVPARAQVTLDFELDSEPIAGSLRGANGRTTAFNGWIQLVSLLQDAATTRAPQAGQRPALVVAPWPDKDV